MRTTYSLTDMGFFMAPPFMESTWNLLDDTPFMAPSFMEPSSWHLLHGTAPPPAEDGAPEDRTPCWGQNPC